MAEFGVNATQLSAPQGAGTAPIAATSVNALSNGVGGLLSQIGDIFAKGLDNDARAKAKEQENAIVSRYSQSLAAIEQAVATGSLKPNEASVRQRALHREYLAGFSQYVDSFEKVRRSFMEGSTLGDVEAQRKTELELRKERISAAQKAGFPISEGMSESVINAMVDAHQAAVRTEQEVTRFYRDQEEQRKTQRYGNEVLDRERKEKSISLINDIAGTNMDVSVKYIQDIVDRRKTGKIDQKTAELEWAAYEARLNSQIVAAAGQEPGLAAQYRTLFEQVFTTGRKMLDPEADMKILDNQIKTILNQQKLLALSRPELAQGAALYSLFPDASVALKYGPDMIRYYNSLSKGNTPGVPADPVVGVPDREKPVFEQAIANMRALKRGEGDTPEARQALNGVVNNTLKQMGSLLESNDPKLFKNAVEFISSAEFGEYATKNKIDPQAMEGAGRAYKMVYEKAIVDGVMAQMNRAFTSNTGLVPARAATGETLTPKTSSFSPADFTMVYRNGGVQFETKRTPTNEVERQQLQQVYKQLRDAEKAVTQVVRMSAHLEGNTDYGSAWEKNKATLFPGMFEKSTSKPAQTDGSYKNESDLSSKVKLTPAEEARAARQESSAANLAELDKELARKNLSPAARAALEEYRATLTKGN